jgi:hypothetical protein
VGDPPTPGDLQEEIIPPNGLTKLIDSVYLTFADLDPEEFQNQWEEPVKPWERKVPELIMDQKEGKKLWSFLLKKRDQNPGVIVVACRGDRREDSLALGMADALRLSRKQVLRLGKEDYNYAGVEPSNRHVYEMVKSTRGLVAT